MERTIRNGRIRRAWKRYQKLALRLLDTYPNYSDEQRVFKPSSSQWSIAQVFFHLEQMQELARMAMHRRIESGKYKAATLKHAWRYQRLVIALMLPVKYVVPPAAAATQSDSVRQQIYPESWLESLKQMELFLQGIPESQENNLLFMHPYAGQLPVRMALGFLAVHLKHHKRQINRIKSSPGFPLAVDHRLLKTHLKNV